jgi:DNA-binding transcriptional LysR family regulator
MEFRDIRSFLAAANLGSISKAAEVLGYTQSAVTVQIHHLENEIGVPLFDRSGKCVTLTDYGRTFCKYAQGLENQMAEIVEKTQASDELKGELRIGAIESVSYGILPPLLAEYQEHYPHVQISLEIDSPTILLDHMDRNLLDMVYILDQRIIEPRWEKVVGAPEAVVFAASADHPLAGRAEVSLDDILAWPIMLTEAKQSYREALEHFLLAEHRSIQPVISSGSTNFLIQMLDQRSGIAFLPEFTTRSAVADGRVKILNVRDLHFTIWRQLICSKKRYVTRRMKAFFDIAKK